MIHRLEAKDPWQIHAERNVLQTGFWATLKQRLGRDALGFALDSVYGSTDLLVVLYGIGSGNRAAYVPWGPNLSVDPDAQGFFLEELSQRLADRLGEECVFIRYDLPWQSPFAGDSAAGWNTQEEGPPPPHVRELRMNFGTEEKNLRKAPTDVQPTDTIVIDTTRAEEELLQRMRSKTRYNIRLAGRRGVRVREASVSELPIWYDLYRETMERKELTVHDYEYFRELFATYNEPVSGRPGLHLLLAEKAGSPLAGLVLAVEDDYALYLYGASSSTERGAMAPYLLQWRALQIAKQAGSSWYDLFGIPPDRRPGHPMHGLLQFKRGFGGMEVVRRGCWDYPIQPERYRALRGQEISGPTYHARHA
jgi:lipid II:glycine glycyltransferase (peptidoglycan interpeptide bridge formation enzyme)